jgi:hypothetical protein
MDKSIETIVKEATKQGVLSLEVRTGQLNDVLRPLQINIKGLITAPSDYVEQRSQIVSKEHCILSADKKNLTLSLEINDLDPELYQKVVGKIELSEEIRILGINNEKIFDPKELSKVLKKMPYVFENMIDYTKTVSSLKNFKAKVQKEIEQNQDSRGNKTDMLTQAVESNLPDQINLVIPFLQGEEKRKISIEICLEVQNGDIICYLESVELSQELESEINAVFEREIERIKEKVTVIYIS